MPPTIPAMRPENADTPLTAAIPKHNGTATRNTISPAGKSALNCEKYFFMKLFLCFKMGGL